MKILYFNKKNLGKATVLTGLGLMLLAGSCKKYTQIDPVNALAETTGFSTPSTIELVMNGVYQQASIGTYNGSTIGGGRGYPFGAAAIEQSEMRGEDMVNLQTFYAITYQSTYTSASANNSNMWDNLYNLINNCNVMITGVEKAGASGVISAALTNSYEGEARFLRALAHHELLLNFCRPYADGAGSKPGVPYRVVAINSPAAVQENLKLDRGTVAQDYVKILADLDYAEANLPATALSGGISRATKGAAIALKTRIYLHMGMWQKVIDEGVKLGTGTSPYKSPIGNYALTSSPDGPFTAFTANSESIFSIANGKNSNPDVNGALGQMFGASAFKGRNLVGTSPNLFNASFWVAGDLRRSLLQIKNDPALGGDGLYYNYKYRDPLTKTDWAPILRYAEVLLNVAEANARLGQNGPALGLLNAVRNRSVPAAAQFIIAPADLILAILNERRVEFAGEGRRWGDVHRLALDATYGIGGIPAKLNPAQITAASYGVPTSITPGRAKIVYTDYRFLWPFPTTETNSNPTLAAQQNPGY